MENQTDIFADSQPVLVQASSGTRLANYFIDLLIFAIAVFISGMIIEMVNPQAFDYFDNANPLLDRLIGFLMYGIFMGFVEGIFKGKTIGKMITGTRAVNEDGSGIDFKTAFLRGLSRAVPFNAFSALGNPSYPWHDRWTSTYVIDEKQSVVPAQA